MLPLTEDQLSLQDGEDFKTWMRRIRKALGYDVTESAQRVKKPHSWLSRLEAGDPKRADGSDARPALDTLKMISQMYNIPLRYVSAAAGYPSEPRKPITYIDMGSLTAIGADGEQVVTFTPEDTMRLYNSLFATTRALDGLSDTHKSETEKITKTADKMSVCLDRLELLVDKLSSRSQ